ncbi:MAG: L,D-transpeptidase [Acidimicrobiia bacterium]
MSSVSDAPATSSTLRPVRITWPLFLALVALPLIAACGALDYAAAETLPPTTAVETVGAPPPVTVSPHEVPPSTVRETESEPLRWMAARAETRLPVFRTPGDARPFRVLDEQTILGTPIVVLIIRDTGDWMEVILPGRPNGETGWITDTGIERYEVQRQAVIDLTNRTLRVFDGDEIILETTVGIGAPSSPTPTGTFFVTDAVPITVPTGPWGAYAFGLSARSDTITEFNGGDGIIGIHGTTRLDSIGEARSLGCVRLANDVMLELAELLAVGSPVTITG